MLEFNLKKIQKDLRMFNNSMDQLDYFFNIGQSDWVEMRDNIKFYICIFQCLNYINVDKIFKIYLVIVLEDILRQ